MATTPKKKPQAKAKSASKAQPAKTVAAKAANGAVLKAAGKPDQKPKPTAPKPSPSAAAKSTAGKSAEKPSAKAAAATKSAAKPAAPVAAGKSGGKSKAAKAAPPPVEVYVSAFSVGNRITHATFGEGKVLAVDGDQLTIKFGAGEKVIIDSFVKAGAKG